MYHANIKNKKQHQQNTLSFYINFVHSNPSAAAAGPTLAAPPTTKDYSTPLRSGGLLADASPQWWFKTSQEDRNHPSSLSTHTHDRCGYNY